MRVLLYAQQLSGVGHFMRILEIAKQMSRSHDVWMIDGGRPVPRADIARVKMLPLPRICRADDGLAAIDSGQQIDQVMTARKAALSEAVLAMQPDAVVIEHYPFSKWDLEEEIGSLLQGARAANPAVKIICSIRDIPPQTRHEKCSSEQYVEQVLQRLHQTFDGLMIHGDPQLTSLDKFFTGAGQIRLPMAHTGIVAENIPMLPPTPISPDLIGQGKFVIASAGGGKDAIGLLDRVREAWCELRRNGHLADHYLLLFGGLDDAGTHPWPEEQMKCGIFPLPFSQDYFRWMQKCQLSISCAGYNTCANILRTACRAILIPNTAMSDQTARAELLARVGMKVMLPLQADPRGLADQILRTLSADKPEYAIDLDGAIASERFICSIVNRPH